MKTKCTTIEEVDDHGECIEKTATRIVTRIGETRIAATIAPTDHKLVDRFRDIIHDIEQGNQTNLFTPKPDDIVLTASFRCPEPGKKMRDLELPFDAKSVSVQDQEILHSLAEAHLPVEIVIRRKTTV